MTTVVLFGAEACARGQCPTHAIAALAASLVVGYVVGFFAGRRGKAAKKGASQRRAREQKPCREARAAEPARQPVPAGSVEIYVGNLSYDLTEEQLRKEFEVFGKVDAARIVTNKFNDKSKGFGFVVMPNRPEAEAAIAAMSEKEVQGRKMRVNEARNTLKEDEA